MATSIAATTARRAANLTRVSISSSPATRAASLISRRCHSDAAAKTTLSWERKFANVMSFSMMYLVTGVSYYSIGFATCKLLPIEVKVDVDWEPAK